MVGIEGYLYKCIDPECDYFILTNNKIRLDVVREIIKKTII